MNFLEKIYQEKLLDLYCQSYGFYLFIYLFYLFICK